MPVGKKKEGIILRVKVQPKAKKEGIAGIEGDRLKLKVNAPPEKGKANAACIKLLAKALGIAKSEIELLQGQTSREKVFLLKGLDIEEVKKRLGVS